MTSRAVNNVAIHKTAARRFAIRNIVRGKAYELPKEWTDAVDRWVGYLTAAGRSRDTLHTRRGAVRMIARESGTQRPGDLDPDWLIGFCGRQAWSTDHRRTMRTSLNQFYQWACAAGVCDSNPAAVLPVSPMSRPRPRPVTDEVWQRVLATAAPRERLMARLACEAGLRRAEVAQVRRDDLIEDAGGWWLIVHGKGARQRAVALNDSLAAEIRGFSSGWSPRGYVFPGQYDGHLSPNWVGKKISDLMPRGWSMHKLRHRFASRGFAGTKDLPAVQAALGHASLATTQRYVATGKDNIRAVSEAAA